MEERIDIIFFGITGIVGKLGIKYLYKFGKEKNISWGIAGRNYEKIKSVLDNFKKVAKDEDLDNIPIFIADLNDENSLIEMTKKTKLLINSCGPLKSSGEKIVKICIQTKTHYLDICNEEIFINSIQLKYQKEAEEAKIFIVSACGADSVFWEVGALYLQDKFPGTIEYIETYCKIAYDDPNESGQICNSTPWNDTITLLHHQNEVFELRAKIFKENGPSEVSKTIRNSPFESPMGNNTWAIPYSRFDHSFITIENTLGKTQQYISESENKPLVKHYFYNVFNSLYEARSYSFSIKVIEFFAKYQFGKNLLLKYPHIFSFGLFRNEDPPDEELDKQVIEMVQIGHGWKDTTPQDRMTMSVKVKAKNPYETTALCVILPAFIMIEEPSNLPSKFGIYTPGVTFRHTSLHQQLEKTGLHYQIMNE